jgi:hypothetical protein
VTGSAKGLAGKLDSGEGILDAAGRELLEETGHAARHWEHVGDARVEHPEIAVGQRRRLLDVAESLDKIRLGRHRDAGNVETILAAQRLHAGVGGVGQFLLAEEILCDSRHGELLSLQAGAKRFVRPARQGNSSLGSTCQCQD